MVTMSQKSSVPQAVKSVSRVLMPDSRNDQIEYPDYLGLGNRLMFSGATIAVRSGRDNATSRVKELREFIYGWASFRGLIVGC